MPQWAEAQWVSSSLSLLRGLQDWNAPMKIFPKGQAGSCFKALSHVICYIWGDWQQTGWLYPKCRCSLKLSPFCSDALFGILSIVEEGITRFLPKKRKIVFSFQLIVCFKEPLWFGFYSVYIWHPKNLRHSLCDGLSNPWDFSTGVAFGSCLQETAQSLYACSVYSL